jgi:hypothetical protein
VRTRLFARREQSVESRRLQLDTRVAHLRRRRFDLRLKPLALFRALKHATRRHAHALNRKEHRAVLCEQTPLDNVARVAQLFRSHAASVERAAQRGVKGRRTKVSGWRRSESVGFRFSRAAVVCGWGVLAFSAHARFFGRVPERFVVSHFSRRTRA